MAYIQDINLPSTSNQKIIKNYLFDATNKIVTINEDFDTILYIYCLENNQLIYNPTAKGFGGDILGNKILLDYNVTTYEDFYKLLIVVEHKQHNSTQLTLNNILEELKEQTKLLKKIYNPE